jgi:hypothetical protein
MASYNYAVLIQVPTKPEQDVTQLDNAPWNHASATRWAHVQGAQLPAGTEIRIWRWWRRGHDTTGRILWDRGAQHRQYVVGEDGIVRRIDR